MKLISLLTVAKRGALLACGRPLDYSTTVEVLGSDMTWCLSSTSNCVVQINLRHILVQLEYAAIDAAVLVHIFRHVRNHSQTAEGEKPEWKSCIVSTDTKTFPMNCHRAWTFLHWTIECVGLIYRFPTWIIRRPKRVVERSHQKLETKEEQQQLG